MNADQTLHLGDDVVVDLSISDEWKTFDPRIPADEVEALAEFDALTMVVERYGDSETQEGVRRSRTITEAALGALGAVGVSLVGTWGRLVANGDLVEPLAGWFTLAVVDDPDASNEDLSGRRDAIVAAAAAGVPAVGESVLASTELVELTAGPALCTVWEVRPPEEEEQFHGFRTTEYFLPVCGSSATALLSCTCPISGFENDWAEVFRSLADAMTPRVIDGGVRNSVDVEHPR